MSDVDLPDAEAVDEVYRQYTKGSLTEQELDEKYPNRPHNHGRTLPFHDLFTTLFNPLNEVRRKPTGPVIARRKQGPHGPPNLNPNESRRAIIERFISRWRKEVGNDIYPAFRLIIPEKDRDRAMYGLKEKNIAKLLIKVMGINKESEDAYNLLNWKLPGQTLTSRMAGDFPGRCYDVLLKRYKLKDPGNMTIADVNEKLDQLSAAQKDDQMLPIMRDFYEHMNPEELQWLIRMILRQMKVGATERTFFAIWHPDAESLFNVSSSLRRVCWELYDLNIRLEGDDRGISLMQCFQPQLAQFQMHDFSKMVARMRPTEDDDAFWIEEKLDGERMQLHMIADDSIPGGKRFGFWSRKAKDYTYLYGNGFQDENGALTRHIKQAFDPGVRNIILDGEMITWDPEQDAMVPFGTLKTAALSEQRNPFSTGHRPLYRVFDILYLNDQVLTNYTLRDRRAALGASIKPVHRRMEIHTYVEAHKADEIEPHLRKVVEEASEGLVLKNPRSMYRLNDRNDDWLKVKPEYMTEFGEALDCIVIGGYYGSGNRGGRLSSFLCGLRVDENQIRHGANPMKCFSFFKVGGGFTAADYSSIRHHTDGKWKEWDPKKPPGQFIELAGGDRQSERPDVWIRPDKSVVVSVKAASVAYTDDYRMGMTLRFPRFKSLRTDRDWTSALSIQGFLDLKNNAEREHRENQKKFVVDDARKKRAGTRKKKAIVVAGNETKSKTSYGGPHTGAFQGLNFYIMTESFKPEKKSKSELEQLVKENGGKIFQSATAAENMICVADRNLTSVASLQKRGKHSIIRPLWLFDCIRQSQFDVGRPSFLVPFEPRHMFHLIEENEERIEYNVDQYGDSYVRDVTIDELRDIFQGMPEPKLRRDQTVLFEDFQSHGLELRALPGSMFVGLRVYFHREISRQTNGHPIECEQTPSAHSSINPELDKAALLVKFAGGQIVDQLQQTDDSRVTHVIVGSERSMSQDIRKTLAREVRGELPRLVTLDWILRSWEERTLLDEERFAPT